MKDRKRYLHTIKHRLADNTDKLRIVEIATHGNPLSTEEANGLSMIISQIISDLEALTNLIEIHDADHNLVLMPMGRSNGSGPDKSSSDIA